MTLDEFLEKYNCTMNLNEIEKIEDSKIKNIKMKYWTLKHNAFINETEIKDKELESVYEEYNKLEKDELINCFKEINR